LKYNYLYNLDVRTSAHRPTVQVGRHLICLLCFSFKRNKNQTNSEADLTSSDIHINAVALVSRYAVVCSSNEPNRPHISSDISSFK